MNHIYESLLSWARAGRGNPAQAQIHLTNLCNLACVFCPTRTLIGSGVKRENELSKDEWLSIIDQGNELGVMEWHICGGGEPLFDKDVALSVMQRIKDSGRSGELITNGTLFNDVDVGVIVNMGWDKIFFSLDSPSAETHNDIRGADCFGKVTKNIRLFSDAKGRRKLSKPALCLHMVVCNKNYNRIADMVRLASELGVQEVVINALNVWKKEMAALELSGMQEAEMQNVLRDAIKCADELGIGNNFREFLKSDLLNKANEMDDAMKGSRADTHEEDFKNASCYYPWYNISIFADGTVQPCFIPQGVGERLMKKSLKDIWNGPVFNSARKECLKGQLSGYCARCNPWNLPKMEELRNYLRDAV